MNLINHYSMLLAAAVILGATAFFLLRDGYQPRDGIVLIVVAVVLVVGWLALRPRPGSPDDVARFQSTLGQGEHVLLELQSPF